MKFNVAILVLGLILLSAATLFNSHSFLFDEKLFPPNVELMDEYGFGKKFLVEMKDQAPGPLYEFIHLPLKQITGLTARGLRAVNLTLFYGVIIALAFFYYKAQQQNLQQSVYSSLHILAIPTLWQVAGLALTEVPAMLFVTISFYFGILLLKKSSELSKGQIILYSITMGLTGGMAMLGRTPYLILVPAFLCVLLFQKYFLNQKIDFARSFLPFCLISLGMIIPIFIVWGGLVPPLQPRVDGVIKPWHGLLAMAYTCVIGFILNPYIPMSTTVVKVFGLKFLLIYGFFISPLLATFGIYFLLCCYHRGKENIADPVYLFAILITLAILASSAKISHQFSSRYVAQAAPFLVIIFTRIDQEDKWKWARLIIGMTMSFLSLNTYAKVI